MAEDTKIQRHSLHTEHHQNPDGHHALRDSALLFFTGLHMTFANNLSTASEMQAADTHVAFQNASLPSSPRFATPTVAMVHPTVRVREIG